LKLFDIDWADGFLARLAAWGEVPLAGRRAFLKLKPSQSAKATVLGDALPSLVEAGLVQTHLEGAKVSVAQEARPFSRVMRAMDRHRLHDVPSRQAMEAYIADHLTHDERATLLSNRYWGYRSWRDLVIVASSVEWIGGFLEAKSAEAWEERALEWEQAGYFAMPGSFEKTKKLVRALVERGSPLAFSELRRAVSGIGPRLLGACIGAAFRYLLLFPALRRENLEPVIGAWPAVIDRMKRAPAKRPSAVAPEQTFRASFLADDVTAFLVACAAEPLRLRVNDHQLFSRARERVAGGFVPFPPWVETVVRLAPPERADAALACCRAMKLALGTEIDGKPFVTATPEGLEWLALSSKERLKALVDRVKAIDFRDFYSRTAGDFAFPPLAHEFSLDRRGEFDLPAAVGRAFAGVADRGFVPLKPFLSYQAERANPLVKAAGKGRRREIRIGWRYVEPTREELEGLWMELLAGYLRMRLIPLGGVELGLDGEGGHCFALTSVGRYVLGVSDDFDHAEEQTGELVVQPNFEVVFMSPSPRAEAEIGRFSERTGAGVGAVFRITQGSVFAAAGAGLTADGVIETLRGFAAKAVPANVEREVRGWFDRCRRVSISPATLIRCPDSETAARVVAAAGNRRIVPVSDTVLELRDTARKADLLRRLRAQGLFVDLQQ